MKANFESVGMFINGKRVDSPTAESFEVENPATGETVGSYAIGNRQTTRSALEAAWIALPSWSETSARGRSHLLQDIAHLLLKNREQIAKIITLENGKPIGESRGEVGAAAAHFEWYAEEGCRVYGRTIPPTAGGKRHIVIKQPVGVAACIIPWNFPVVLWARKVAAALAAGCTVVTRSASQTTLSVLSIMDLIQKAGLPPGALNAVTGNAGEISDELFQNQICRKISFTGSTEVGRKLIEKSAQQIKNLSLELGGQAPAIVCGDADLNLAVSKVLGAKFRNTGRSCLAVNRIYVQDQVYEKFLSRFLDKAKKLKIGNGMEEGVDLGPMIDEESLEKYLLHVENIRNNGGKIMYGGKRLSEGVYAKGWFAQPCIATEVKDTMLCMCDETFGPLAPVASFKTLDEVIERANSTPYGLSAYIYTTDLGTAFLLGEKIEAGMIAINDDVPSTTIAPFGGVKESGIGRECGSEGIEAFLETKHMSIQL